MMAQVTDHLNVGLINAQGVLSSGSLSCRGMVQYILQLWETVIKWIWATGRLAPLATLQY